MALFEYKAVAPNGETLRGQMEAPSADAVIAKLQESGNIPLSAKETGGGALSLGALFGRKAGPGPRIIGEFTHNLAVLLGAGLPLDRALQVLIDLADDGRMQRLVEKIRDRVREGGSLSDALEEQHGVFSRLYVNMVRAGEIGGSLEQTLERLSDYMERSKELKDHVLTAMFYPGLLLVVAIAAITVLMVYVIPQFTPIFEDLGAELPLLTRVVMGTAEFIKSRWWLILLAAILLIWWWRGQRTDPERRLVWDLRFLEMRWIGDLLGKLETARLARTIGTLLENGVPLLTAMSIARNVCNNSYLRQVVNEASKKVKTGSGLARTLAADGHFPRLALQMISVGEETGQLDRMLNRVADTYDREVRMTADRLLSLFTPIMIIGLALLIGGIVMSVVVAMLSINELVG
ncbi:MAG: type II secretion system F family protein [Wenzhouxiangellaceae bacterium]